MPPDASYQNVAIVYQRGLARLPTVSIKGHTWPFVRPCTTRGERSRWDTAEPDGLQCGQVSLNTSLVPGNGPVVAHWRRSAHRCFHTFYCRPEDD
jgi:hypothetical protein